MFAGVPTLYETYDRHNRANFYANIENELEEHLRRTVLLLGMCNYDEKAPRC